MKLYLIEMMSGNRQYVVANSMEEAVKSAEKPFHCELVADTQYWDNLPQLKILSEQAE